MKYLKTRKNSTIATLLAASLLLTLPALLAAHEGHDHDDDVIRLSAEQRQRFGIKVESAAPIRLRRSITLPGEVLFNDDRLVHVTPRVAGVASELHKSVGERVEAGELLAVLESRELADSKADYFAARARASLAERLFEREERLHRERVSAEQEFLQAEQALAEARIALRATSHKLLALGLTKSELEALDEKRDESITRHEIRAPLAGVVVTRTVVLGESLSAEAELFTIADLATVWIDLAIHLRHLGEVRVGQEASVHLEHNGAAAEARIAMVTPFAVGGSRSATARVEIDNSSGKWIPGAFANVAIAVAEEEVALAVPLKALQQMDGHDLLFVEHEDGFEVAEVKVGKRDATHVEILAGLKQGERYVAEGAFEIKATLVTSALGAHAGHGH